VSIDIILNDPSIGINDKHIQIANNVHVTAGFFGLARKTSFECVPLCYRCGECWGRLYEYIACKILLCRIFLLFLKLFKNTVDV